MTEDSQHKVMLIVIDGWGIRESTKDNYQGDAIQQADTPVMDDLMAKANSKRAQGFTTLDASSLAVGLPRGLMGNSEVGHLNIGAGRVVWQDVVRIDTTIEQDKLGTVKGIEETFQKAITGTGRLHLMGLVSDGGVHSHVNHLYALLSVARKMQVPKVYVHAFTDGRDTSPRSGLGHIDALIKNLNQPSKSETKLATIIGRYYAMDRDKRWDRVEQAVRAIIQGKGEQINEESKVIEIIQKRYDDNETDEFLKAIVIGGDERRVQSGDSVFCFNYRSDRMREITQLLGNVDRSPTGELEYPEDITLTTMTQYNNAYNFPVAFPPQRMENVLSEWISKQNLQQCHIAETEKYAHVTFFFNGGVERQFTGETRELIASPKVATYDLKPEMSVEGVSDRVCETLDKKNSSFVLVNLAPPDMVGHTGKLKETIKAVSTTDKCIGKIYDACKRNGYVLFITADHGNAEEMINEQGGEKTSHTTNRVPFIMSNAPRSWRLASADGGKTGYVKDAVVDLKRNGILGDVAPTILDVMDIKIPEEMDGKSLLVRGIE